MTIKIETHPGGTDGDNLVKTRLATGEMADIFFYNSGSLLQALNPTETLVDLSGEPYIANIQESFLPTVSAERRRSSACRPAPLGGGILYNKKIYADHGLQVPKTWAEFEANNDKLKAAGNAAPVVRTYGDTWTSQLFVLADYYNVAGGRTRTSPRTTPPTRRTTPTRPRPWPASSTCRRRFDEGLVAEGLRRRQVRDGPEDAGRRQVRPVPDADLRRRHHGHELPRRRSNDIGFFGQPGDDAATNGATIWMPAATYIPKTTTGAQLDAAKDFRTSSPRSTAADAHDRGRRPVGPVRDQGVRRCPTTCCRP